MERRLARQSKTKCLELIRNEETPALHGDYPPTPPPLSERMKSSTGRGLNSLTASGDMSHSKPMYAGRGLMRKINPLRQQYKEVSIQKSQCISVTSHFEEKVQQDDECNSGGSDSGSESCSSSTSGEVTFSENDSDDDSSHNTDEDEISRQEATCSGRDGTNWRTAGTSGSIKFATQNIFRVKSGTTAYCNFISCPLDAFRLLVDDGLLRYIQQCTIEYGRSSNSDFTIELDELDAYIGLLYLRGVMNQKNFPVNLLWSKEYGNKKFMSAMSRDRFIEIRKMIRFDVRSTRRERVATDKYALMRYVHTRIVDNFKKAYRPNEYLCIDEQLFPTKSRCRFLQYMANKPDKFGIKFWALVEVDSKYCINLIPYLGKDENRVDNLGVHVVMSLMENYLDKGYNICCDNFFTSYNLARKLMERSTSIVGTVRENRRELPPKRSLDLHQSVFYECNGVNLVQYKGKQNKTVFLLSTLHRGSVCQKDGKKKPESIVFYNKNKCGVDKLDDMCKRLSTKSSTRRWPFAVFCNLLDIAAINSWIIYKKSCSSTMSRREFIMQLSEQLCSKSIATRNVMNEVKSNATTDNTFSQRTDCRIRVNCHKNRTKERCSKCSLPTCGQCQVTICCKCANE
jgi:hypothetical protein